jgi:hypothetical protein
MGDPTPLTYDAFRLGAAVLFVVAGILRVVRGQVTGRQHSGLVGASLFVLGALSLPLGDRTGQLGPGAHAVGTVICLGLTLTALTGSRPRTVLGFAVAAPVLILEALHAPVPGELVLAGCWLAVGAVAARRDAEQPWAGRLSPLLGSMGVVELLRSLDRLQPGSWTLSAAALLASVAMVTAHCAYVDLREAARATRPAERVRRRPPVEDDGSSVDFGVTGVVASVADRHRLSGQEVRVRGGAGVAHGRPSDLVDTLDELLANAHRYAPSSPVTVQVVAIGSRVEVSVADRGPGLSAGMADRAFDAGPGLSRARELMRRNHGDLELRTRIGGATFVVSLPAAEVATRTAASLSPCAG